MTIPILLKTGTTIAFAIVTTACAAGPSADANAPEKSTTTTTETETSDDNQQTLATIEAFLADPETVDPAPILAFVQDSPDVLVVFRQALTSVKGVDERVAPLMLAGFAAGNARAQLQRNQKQDAPVAGVRGMLAVYEKLKERTPDLRLDNLDAWAKHDAEGTLDDAVTKAIAADE